MQPAYPIETERLKLRPLTGADYDALYAYQSREDVTRLLYWGPRTPDEVREALERKIASVAISTEGDVIALGVVLKDTGELIGDFVLEFVSQEHRQGEIGYIIHPDHQGHGYATEAGRELLRIAFEDLKLHRVVGRTRAAQRRLVARAGEAGDAAGGAPRRERVRPRRMAERAGLRDAGPRVGLSATSACRTAY